MFHRLLKTSKTQSFFIFGARGTGKSTYIKTYFPTSSKLIDLLSEQTFMRYSNNPDLLIKDLEGPVKVPGWVIVDEIQRVPGLLNVIHQLIENKKYKFILTGSSARKLKRSSANLLAGRAFNYQFFPLTHRELGPRFDLDESLNWGGLPKLFELETEDRKDYLKAYAQLYLREEILQEQIVRNGIAFRSFLEVAAQTNGALINYSKVARDLGVDTKTVQNYYQILEDTLVGFFLPAFHQSARKSVGLQAKFYLFDLGIKRAIEGSLDQALSPRTPAYGLAFEHFIICETLRLNAYSKKDYSLYQYHTTAGGEVDLILKRGRELIAVEIKSANNVDLKRVTAFEKTCQALKVQKLYYVSQDPHPIRHGQVRCMPWTDFLTEVFPT